MCIHGCVRTIEGDFMKTLGNIFGLKMRNFSLNT